MSDFFSGSKRRKICLIQTGSFIFTKKKFSRSLFIFGVSEYSFAFTKEKSLFMLGVLVCSHERETPFHVRSTRLLPRKKNLFEVSKYSFISAKKKLFLMFGVLVYFHEKKTPFHARSTRLFPRKKNLHEVFENSCSKYFDIIINLYESSDKEFIIIEKFFNQKQLNLRTSYTIDEDRMNKRYIMKLSRRNKIMNISSWWI